MSDLDKLAYSLPELAKSTGLSIDTIRKAINNHYLPRHYYGRKPLILASDAQEWLESLPTEPT